MSDNNNNTVILYRSKFEQSADEYWPNMIEEHPDFFLGVIITIVFLVIGVSIWNTRPMREIRRFCLICGVIVWNSIREFIRRKR